MTDTIKQALAIAEGEFLQSDSPRLTRNSCLLTASQLSAAIYTRIPTVSSVVTSVSGLTNSSVDALSQNRLPICWVRKVSGI